MKGSDAFAEGRVIATDRWPYLSPALWALTPVETPGSFTSMSDPYFRYYYDPTQDWDTQVMASHLAHEVWHILWRHFERGADLGITPGCSPQMLQDFNLAADCTINPQVLKEGGKFLDRIKLPNGKVITEHNGRKIGAFLPQEFGWKEGLTAEEYYELLTKRRKEGKPTPGMGEGDIGQRLGPGAGGSCGSCATGVPGPHDLPAPKDCDTPGVDDSEHDQIADRVATAIEEHERSRPGTVGALGKLFVNERRKSKVNWRHRLPAALLTSLERVRGGQADYSFTHRSRRQGRMVGNTPIIPALVAPKQRIGILIDTSGSMHQGLLAQALGEIDGLIRSRGLEDVTVMCNDVESGAAHKVRHSKQVSLQGGGGTNLCNGITKFAGMKPTERPHVLVVLTDGDSPWQMPEPKGMKVILVILSDYDNAYPSWAEVIKVQ